MEEYQVDDQGMPLFPVNVGLDVHYCGADWDVEEKHVYPNTLEPLFHVKRTNFRWREGVDIMFGAASFMLVQWGVRMISKKRTDVLIIQRIETAFHERGKGHFSALVDHLMERAAHHNVGIVFQSVLCDGLKQALKRRGFTEKYGDWVWIQ